MTLQEIKERIAAYESKWGKLGHTNIMKPENEIQHSALNERRNTMIKTTNDFYKFRQKVAIGKEANKLAHKATISPEELNERNFQNQLDNNTLIHAGKNFKYVAKEDVNGKPRYFYTQEEYDAFKNTGKSAGNAGDMAGKLVKSAANDVFKPENDRSKSVENYNNNARAALVSGIVEISKNGGSKAAADAMKDNSDYKLYMQMIQHAIDKGVDPKEHTVEETGKLLGKDYADAIKDAENNLREYFDAVPGLKDDLAKIALDDLAEMRKKNKKGTVLESVGDKLGEDLDKGIAKSNIGEAVTKNIKHSAFDEEDETPSCKTAADLRQEREESIMSEYRAFKARANKGAEKNRLSHSAVISPKDLNAKYEEELMKEYIAIHPENDDFESLSHSGKNFKYYNKIDLPNGTTRYFYTKAEWDAYQDGQGQSKKQEQERTVKKNADAAAHEGDRYAKKPLPKSATMTDEERKEMYEGLAKKAKIHNQQVENYKKNEAAAKAEGERMAQKYSAMSSTVSSTNKKPSEALEENKPKETTKNEQDDFFKKEHTDYVQKNAERINNEYNKAAEDEHNTSLQIDEKYGFNKAKTEEEVNKCWDNLVQDMYQNALTIDNPDKCSMNFFWHDENGNGSAGWNISIPEFDKWAQEYQKEIDKVFEQGYNATNLDDKKKYGDQWEAMNEELRVRTQEAQTKALKMVTELKKKCLEQ